MTELEQYRASTVRGWIRFVCRITLGLGGLSLMLLVIGLVGRFPADAIHIDWSFGGDHGWAWKSPVQHPMVIVPILLSTAWTFGGWGILRGQRWAIDVVLAALAFHTLDGLVTIGLSLAHGELSDGFSVGFLFPLAAIGIALGQRSEWRSPRRFQASV